MLAPGVGGIGFLVGFFFCGGCFFFPPVPVTGAQRWHQAPCPAWHLPAKVTGETVGSRPPALGHLLNNVCNKLLPRGQLNP